MPSNNKNIIGDLRGKFDPHYKLASNVEGIEKGLGVEVAQIHKTLSKSFAMQRKTLVRVLGLEKRVNVLELEQAAEEQAKEGIDEILNDLGEDVEQEVGSGVATKKKLKAKKTKITGEAFKKGTVLDEGFKSRVLGQDEDGEYLSGEERKARFKSGPLINPDKINQDDDEEEVKSPVGEGLKNILNSIAGTTESIKNLLIGQQKGDRDAAKDSAKDTQNAARSGQEKKLETKVFDGVKTVGEKVLKPVQGIFEKIWGFVKKVLLADIIRRLFNWLSDDDNKKKVGSIFRFIKDWWPALLTGFLLFGTGMGSLITGTVAAIGGFIPILMGLLPKLLAFLASPIGLAVLGTAAVVGGGMWVANKISAKNDNNDNKIEAPVKMNKGGSVPGKGNTDTVPAMLTPGEFVLTKEATQKYGTNTLEGMNAAAASGKKETSGIGRGVGSAVGGLAGGVVGFFADSPISPVADIALGLAGSAAGGEIGDNTERKVRGMKKGGKVTDDGLGYGIPGDTRTFLPGKIDPNNLSAGAGEMVVPEGASAYTGKEKEKIEAETLYWVNKERAFMGIEPPLKKITYAQGVYLAKPKGPGPRTKEYTNTVDDWENRTRTTENTKWVEGEGITHSDSIRSLTPEEKEEYLANNPYARIAASIKNQSELDAIGDDISASAKKSAGYNKGGLVQHFNKGGLVQHFNKGGPVQDLVQEHKRLQMLRKRIRPGSNGKYSKEDSARIGQLILQMQEIRKQINAGKKSTPTNNKKVPGNTGRYSSNDKRSKRAKGPGLGRLIGGAADMLTGNLFDFDNKSGGGLIRKVLGGTADALTGNRWDFDRQGKPSAKVTKSKPKSTEIDPPSSFSKSSRSSSKPRVTTINAGAVQPTIDATQQTPPPAVPIFSATIMRSPDKIKTLGIMV